MGFESAGGHLERSRELRVKLAAEEWTERLRNAPIYKKTAIVHIRPATPGELVVTRLANGQHETENVAATDQVVVTNPGGEKQLVDFEKAVQRYDPADVPGLFSAKGMVRAVDNPYRWPISIEAPWGGVQHGDAECKIAALYDPDTPDVISTDRYIIGKAEFAQTYGDQPVGAGVDLEPVPSAAVLAAMEEYNAPETSTRLGAVGLYFANRLPNMGSAG